ncbi:MAG: hypothetical protein WCO56_07300 [Verrucomicrobiota bacterium]
MLPDQPWLIKCPHCAALVWVDEQEQVGEECEYQLSDVENSLGCETPSLQDYLAFLAKGVFKRDKEQYLRMRAWWAGNDQRRLNPNAEPMTEEERTNLRALSVLFDEKNEQQRIMKAEALRELGQFAEAESLLGRPFHPELAEAVAIIRQLVVQKEIAVREMFRERPERQPVQSRRRRHRA